MIFGSTTQITVTSGGVNLLYAILPDFPVPQKIPDYYEDIQVIPLFYGDMIFTDLKKVNTVKITINLPPHLNVSLMNRIFLFKWFFHDKFYGNWEDTSKEEIKYVITNNTETNSITITFDTMDFSGIFALAYGYKEDHGNNHNGDDENGDEIPGYDLLIILGIIGTVSLGVIGIKRKSISRK